MSFSIETKLFCTLNVFLIPSFERVKIILLGSFESEENLKKKEINTRCPVHLKINIYPYYLMFIVH